MRMDVKILIYVLNNIETLTVIYAQFIVHKPAKTTKSFVQDQGVLLMVATEQTNAKTKALMYGEKHQEHRALVGVQDFVLITKFYAIVE